MMAAIHPHHTGVTKTLKGAGSMLLYLDFDGVLHPEDVRSHRKRGVSLVAGSRYRLFQHSGLLEQLLAPYPDIRIVLSTSWVRVYGCAGAAKRLPLSLRNRVIGATFHSRMLQNEFLALPRGLQIWSDVVRRRPFDWLALDDDSDDWPPWCRDQLVATHAVEGISDPAVMRQIEERLHAMVMRDRSKVDAAPGATEVKVTDSNPSKDPENE